MENWLELLREAVRSRGRETVCDELDISKPTLSLVLAGKYPARTDTIEKKVLNTYGADTRVVCPVLGEITALKCRRTYRKAERIGTLASGNPVKFKLYQTCLRCERRGL